MALYDEMQQLAREILGDADFKQGSTQLLRLIPGTGPADDPGAGTLQTVQLDGAIRGVKFKYVQNGLALASDLQITHAVVPGVTPSMNDYIVADGVRFKIVQIVPKPAVGVPVVYTLILRK